MNVKKTYAILLAILAAVFYAAGTPFSKVLMRYAGPTMLAAFLYLGAGVGMMFFGLIRSHVRLPDREEKLEKKDFRFLD